MPEPNGAAKDTETDVVVPRSLTASRLAALSVAGLVGGVVGAVCLGLVGMWIGAALAQGRHDAAVAMGAGMSGFAGAALGLPLGITMGLRAADTKPGVRGRFWPALGASFAGMLLSSSLGGFPIILMRLLRLQFVDMTAGRASLFLHFAAPFVLSLVGGLVGYLGSRPKRPDDTADDS